MKMLADPGVVIDVDRHRHNKVKFEAQYTANVGPVLRRAELARAKEEQLRANKKNEYKRVAALDWVTVMRIKQDHGLDVTNIKTPQERNRLMKVLQTEYPKYLTTNKRVYRPRDKIRFDRGTLNAAT